MLIGVPREIKDNEFRVGMTPSSIREAVAHGHSVMVEANAGAGIGCSDAAYETAGAAVAATADEVFAEADMIVKVKASLVVPVMDAFGADDKPGIGLEIPVGGKRHPVMFQSVCRVLH